MSTDLIDILASYLPALLKQQIASENAEASLQPIAQKFPAVTVFADISGFTTLTENLDQTPSQQGVTGAEEITRLLNEYFDLLINLVVEHGGDIIKFAGDALVAIWPVRTRLTAAPQRALATATRRAAQCALDIQSKLHNYTVSNSVTLSLRIGIGAGDISVQPVGGMFKRWELLMAGRPLVQMNTAQQQAKPGETVFAPAAWSLVKAHCVAEPLMGGNMRLVRIKEPLPLLPLQISQMPPESEALLRAYIPGAVLSRLSAEGMSNWLAELRLVTVVFIKLPDLNHTTGETPRYAQAVMYALQESFYRYEGSINKLSVDDKGTMLLAALGLPPLAHEDDAVRGLQAALEAHVKLDTLGVRHAIAITTGTVFCGTLGNELRREYTMIGDVVNLASRLMQIAPKYTSARQAAILCDENTYQAAQGRIVFDEDIPAIPVKGKAKAVNAYRPINVLQTSIRPKTEMVGRESERTLFGEALQNLIRGGLGNVVIIEGEAGIGKSRLVADLIEQATSMGITTLYGAGDAIEKSTPYFAWREIFSKMLDINVLTDPDARRLHVLNLLEFEEDIYPLAPLLKDSLALDIPDNDLTRQMNAEARSENTRELLIRLMQASVSHSPKVLILEDAHWLDSASWALALRISQRVTPLLMVVATRPVSEHIAPIEYQRLLNAPTTDHLSLSPLPSQLALKLAAQRLGVNELPAPVAELILQKAEGHPFFSEELAYSLREAGVITIEGNICHLNSNTTNLQSLNLPNTLQGIITSRIDRLNPTHQLTLKVASVIGRVFAYSLLYAVYPEDTNKPLLKESLEKLGRLEITPLESPEPDLTYMFKHIITREAAYNLMLSAQRQPLHRAVAEWHEKQYASDLSPHYSLLAHHWVLASIGNDDATFALSKATHYLEKAGEQALRNYANKEAIRFFTELVEMDARRTHDDPKAHKITRARWQRKIGLAYIGLGQHDAASTHLRKALELLGRSDPSNLSNVALRLPGQVLRQTFHRLRARLNNRPRKPPNNLESLLEAARTYERLGEVYYLNNETAPAIYVTMRNLNISEQAGPSPELVAAYAGTCIAASVIPSESLAQAYSHRALETAERVGHKPSHAFALLATSLYNVGFGNWKATEQAAEKGLEINESLDDWTNWGTTLTTLAQAEYYQGNFSRCEELYEKLYQRATHTDNLIQQAWGLNGQSLGIIRQGRTDEALAKMQTAAKLLEKTPNRSEEIVCTGQTALAHLQLGNPEEALKFTQQNLELISQWSPIIYSVLEGYASIAEVYLALWEAHHGSVLKSKEYAQGARQGIKVLNQLARVFPIARPRAWLWQGRYEWLDGKPIKAEQDWYKCIKLAKELEMPYEQGLAYYHLGSSLSSRKPLLSEAIAIFKKLDAAYDLQKTQQAQSR